MIVNGMRGGGGWRLNWELGWMHLDVIFLVNTGVMYRE